MSFGERMHDMAAHPEQLQKELPELLKLQESKLTEFMSLKNAGPEKLEEAEKELHEVIESIMLKEKAIKTKVRGFRLQWERK